ncbi:MAG: hypothetical protein K2N18_00445, partial [Clostridia bacterium]|nr:hypothetical protein [Clostridia bacterium]
MKSGEKKPIDRMRAYECCRAATVFTLLGWLASGLQAVIFLVYTLLAVFIAETFRHSVTDLVLSVFATMAGIAAMVVGIVAKSNDKKIAITCTVLTVFSATLALCCLNHPYIGQFFFYVLPITFSGIFNLIATVLYSYFWAMGQVGEDERRTYKAMSADEKSDRDSKDRKKFALTVLVSLLTFGIIVSAVIPTEYFTNCNIVYKQMVYRMGQGKSSGLSDPLISLNRYLKALPEGYKDTDKIREQYKIYKKLENELSNGNTGVEARSALEGMYEIKKTDDRWNFSGYNEKTLLYCDAKWEYGDYYLTVGREAERDELQEFSTNLPYILPDYVDEEIGELTVTRIYRYYPKGFLTTRYEEWILG